MRRSCPSPSQLLLSPPLSTETSCENVGSCSHEGNHAVSRVRRMTNGEFQQLLPGIRRKTERAVTEELLPGIPNDIALDEIATQLPWSALNCLVPVSHCWNRAIHSRMLYDARVRKQSKEKLVVINHIKYSAGGKQVDAIGLYSTRDESFHKLPPLPDHNLKIRPFWQCATVERKICILGRRRHISQQPTGEGYVLDLAGPRQWKQCKSLEFPRKEFGVSLIRGKLHVYGGTCDGNFPPSEVYDPKSDRWESTTRLAFCDGVSLQGQEILMLPSGSWNSKLGRLRVGNLEFNYHDDDNDAHEDKLKILHPLSRGSRPPLQIRSFERSCCQFIAQGELHCMGGHVIDVYDSDRVSWTVRHSFSSAGIWRAIGRKSRASVDIESWTFVVVGNELISLLRWHTGGYLHKHCGATLLQTIGFGGKNKRIFWKNMRCPYEVDVPFFRAPSLSVIEI